MGLRRGFKSEANYYAIEFRKELRLAPHAPLCPWRLAAHLEIPVLPMSEFAALIPEHYAYLSGKDGGSFSALTVFDRSRRLIVHNDSHRRPRQASNIAHELSHGILGHPPMPPLDDIGCRNYNKDLEDEANWLAPALLISEEAALHIARAGFTLEAAADTYGVSKEVMKMRLNVTNAYVRVKRSREYAASRR